MDNFASRGGCRVLAGGKVVNVGGDVKIRELFGMALLALLMCVLVFLSGCQSLRPVAGAGLSAGALAAPQYASVLNEIKHRIDRKPVNPVDGFEFGIVYRFQGAIVDAADITWEERFVRKGSAATGMPPIGPAIATESTEDAVLRNEIRQILQAAGITEEQ